MSISFALHVFSNGKCFILPQKKINGHTINHVFHRSKRANLCPLCKRRFSQITKRPGQKENSSRGRRAGERVRIRKKDLGSRHSDNEDEEQERRTRMLMRQQLRQDAPGPDSFIIIDDTSETPDVQWIPSFQISDDESAGDEEVIEVLSPTQEPNLPSGPQPLEWSSEIIDLTSWVDTEKRPEAQEEQPARTNLVLFADATDDDIGEISQSQPLFPGSPHTEVTISDHEDSPLIIPPVHHHHRRHRRTNRRPRTIDPESLAHLFPPTTTTTTTSTTTTITTEDSTTTESSDGTQQSSPVEEDDSWLNQTVF